MLDLGDRSCVIEASSHAIELHRLDRARFAALAFTNLSQDHLDFHETMENYFAAKRRLFLSGEETPAAINIDDAYGRRLAAELRALGQEKVLTFGRAPDADLRPDEIELGAGERESASASWSCGARYEAPSTPRTCSRRRR